MKHLDRRDFLKTGISLGAASFLAKSRSLRAADGAGPARMCVISSDNGMRATAKAMEMLKQAVDPLDAVIAGVNIIELDPNDTSVGYGGLPNEDGVVELDASVMHGPTHRAGAVAAIRNIKTPSRVARLVMERTDHALLVGEGALRFAKAHGFKEEDLLTDRSREAWLKWKETISDRDFWLAPEPEETKKLDPELRAWLHSYGTINCLAINEKGDIAGVTTTSGRAYKLAGRVGDSPIIGAGLYVDNEVGAAGSTGRGEANIITSGSRTVVCFMEQGLSPEAACLKTLEYIARKNKLTPRLCNPDGTPNFDLDFYAINKKGEYGGASMFNESKFSVHDGMENKLADSAYLFKKKTS
jgi:N4-(beta-N-acetylglucosaminyl)-L-asparaginase